MSLKPSLINKMSYTLDWQMLADFELYAKILAALGHGAMAAHRTLNPLILVRLQVPRPDLLWIHNLMT